MLDATGDIVTNEHKKFLRDALRAAIEHNNAPMCEQLAEMCSAHGMRYDDIAKLVVDAGCDPLEWEALLYEASCEGDE